MSKRVTFDCELDRCLFQKNGYYIYAMKIDRFKYPDINFKWMSYTKATGWVEYDELQNLPHLLQQKMIESDYQ